MEPNRETTRIELVLEYAAEPIRGALLAGGTRREFAGWVELASALELVRHAAPSLCSGRWQNEEERR